MFEQWEGERGIKHTKVYLLTPEAFKNCRLTATALRACLMRAQRRPNQKVDLKVYSRYLFASRKNIQTIYGL